MDTVLLEMMRSGGRNKAWAETMANLEEQGRLLRSKATELYARVEFVSENNKIVGYMISAVHVVISGFAVVGGALMISTMTPLGVLAGAILVMDGLNGLSKEIIPRLSGEKTRHMASVQMDAP